MDNPKITPDKITKPIQLLGAWLVGLLSIDASFLFAATNFESTSWQSGALTIAAILNVPIFIGALFLLQTRFRPELQEDSYYSSYLSNKTNEVVRVSKIEVEKSEIEKKILHSRKSLLQTHPESVDISSLTYGVNAQLKDVNDISNVLSGLGVVEYREFGHDADFPEVRKVAISSALEPAVEKKVLALASDLGFEFYSYIEPYEEISEDVLIGSYGDTHGRLTRRAT